jgi:hypothetical protein
MAHSSPHFFPSHADRSQENVPAVTQAPRASQAVGANVGTGHCVAPSGQYAQDAPQARPAHSSSMAGEPGSSRVQPPR